MKKKLSIKFNDVDTPIYLELDDSQSPKTVKALLDSLPIRAKINRWGDELYTDRTSIATNEENAKSIVNPLDVAYWPEGGAICLFFGPTPISKSPGEILPYSPVNIVGKVISEADMLDQINDGSTIVIETE